MKSDEMAPLSSPLLPRRNSQRDRFDRYTARTLGLSLLVASDGGAVIPAGLGVELETGKHDSG